MSLESTTLERRRPPRRSAPLRSFLLSAGVTLTASARAQVAEAQPGSACAEQRLRVEGSLSPQWFAPVVQLCETLGSMEDIDRSAQLRVVAAGDDVIVEVTLGDGRSTLRRVHAPSDLSLTVEALVAMPPPLPTAAPVPSTPPPEAVARQTFQLDPDLALAPARPARRVSLEVGGAVVGRVAGSATYLSIGLMGYAGLRTGPWLLALTARWDGYQTVVDDRPRDFEMTTVGGGFLLLRELLRSEHMTFEGGVNTWLLGETQAYTPQADELAGSSVDVRIGALSRLVFGDGPLRYLASLDAEVSPGRLRHQLHVIDGLPTLPGWSVGLGIGVAWEAQ